jgi:DNA-binding NarL/FixJ family response regulator
MISILIVDDDEFIRESLRVIISLDTEIDVVGTASHGAQAVEFMTGGCQVDVVLMDIRMPICDGVEGTKRIKELFPDTRVLILTTFDDDEYIIQALENGASGYLLKNIAPDRIIHGIKTVHAGDVLIHPDIARKLATFLRPATSGAMHSYQDSHRSQESQNAQPYPTLQATQSNSTLQATHTNSTSQTTHTNLTLQATQISGKQENSVGQGNALIQYHLTPMEFSIVRYISEGLSNKEISKVCFLSEGTVKNYITDILSKLHLRDRTQIAILYLKAQIS